MDDKEERELIAVLLARVVAGEVSISQAVESLKIRPLVEKKTIPQAVKKKMGRPSKKQRRLEIQFEYDMNQQFFGSERGKNGRYRKRLKEQFHIERIDNELSRNPFTAADRYLDEENIIPVPVGVPVQLMNWVLPELVENIKRGDIPLLTWSDVMKEGFPWGNRNYSIPDNPSDYRYFLLYNNYVKTLKSLVSF